VNNRDASVSDGCTLYAWQVQEASGAWSMVGALIPETFEHSPLIHRNLIIVRRWEGLAHKHAEATNQPLRLARFTLAEVIE
jgi:hypothetical protein